MKKIRLIQNAATFVSDLTIKEIEALQKQNPMALALTEPNAEGGQDIIFSVQSKDAAFGEVNDNRMTFVDSDAEGNACLTVLIPANLTDKSDYLFKKYATAVNFLKIVENQAKNALRLISVSKEKFAEEFIDLDAQNNLAETYEDLKELANVTSNYDEDEDEEEELIEEDEEEFDLAEDEKDGE